MLECVRHFAMVWHLVESRGDWAHREQKVVEFIVDLTMLKSVVMEKGGFGPMFEKVEGVSIPRMSILAG